MEFIEPTAALDRGVLWSELAGPFATEERAMGWIFAPPPLLPMKDGDEPAAVTICRSQPGVYVLSRERMRPNADLVWNVRLEHYVARLGAMAA